MSEKRKVYLDNIRTITVLIVMVYHVFYLFNGVGVLGGFPVEKSLLLGDAFCALVYPWFMILLFCISGIAARFSLKKRGTKKFLKERSIKLLLPSTLGCFVIFWIVGYINIKISGGLDYIPGFLIYPISVLSGSGPLWFAHLVFVYSAIIVLLSKIDTDEKFYNSFEKTGSFALLVIVPLLLWGSSQILNMPVITVYRFGIYLLSFLVGYFVLSHENVLEKIERLLPISTILTTMFLIIYMILFYGENYADDRVLQHIITNLYAWFAVLAILGAGKKYLDFQSPVTAYLNRNSYGLYVLHYLVLMCVAYPLHFYLDLPLWVMVIIILALELLITALLNEIIKRIPILRLVLLGIKRGKNEIQTCN